MTNYRFLNAKGLMALFLCAWSLYIFYPFSLSEPAITADGVTYVHIAKNIFLDGSPGWQATWAAPFFSVLMAVLYPLIGNFAVAGVVVSKIMTALLPLAAYLLAKEIFTPRIGIFAAVLTAFHPHFTFISGTIEPEVTYTTLQVLSLWAIWRAFKSSEVQKFRSSEAEETLPTSQLLNLSASSHRLTSHVSRYSWAVLGGILASLAYQTRSEGLLIFLFAVAAIGMTSLIKWVQGVKGSRDQNTGTLGSSNPRTIILSVVIASFILTSLPYLLFLKGTYGKVVLSPKSAYVQIWMKWKTYHDNDLGEQGNPELWGLNKNGKLMWQEPKGAGDLINYLMSHPEKSLRVYLQNFSQQIPGRIGNNSGQWLYPQVYPWYFAIPALFWITVSLLRKTDWDKTIFLLSPFAILFILPVFTGGWWKYLLPYSPFLIILAVAGADYLSEKFRWKYLLSVFTIVVAVYSLWAVKASLLLKHGNVNIMTRIAMAEEQKKAGEWAQKRFKGTPNYMIQWSKLAYYLNGRWTAMPVTDYYGMVWYARKNRVDYLVFETSGRGESEEIVRIMGNTPDLKVAGIYESQGRSYGIVFLQLRK